MLRKAFAVLCVLFLSVSSVSGEITEEDREIIENLGLLENMELIQSMDILLMEDELKAMDTKTEKDKTHREEKDEKTPSYRVD
ncbi:MAG: hypothetical protein D6778_01435 [Nitrospirae bacterium]|nr:MAG: hypothetical protein D6778_01435 [Nitrospirota bacterium]